MGLFDVFKSKEITGTEVNQAMVNVLLQHVEILKSYNFRLLELEKKVLELELKLNEDRWNRK